MTKFFSKNSYSYLEPEPSNLKVELARDITSNTQKLCADTLKSIDKCRG